MRTLFLLFFSIFILSGQINAQELPINDDSGLISYSGVIEQTGEADALFKKGHKWFFSYYKNAHNVVRESADNKIVAKPRFKILNPPNKKGIQTMGGIVVYTFTAQFKDGKYRYQISNIEWKQSSKYPVERWLDKSAPSYNKKYDFYLKQVDENIRQIIENFKQQMATEAKEKDSDW